MLVSIDGSKKYETLSRAGVYRALSIKYKKTNQKNVILSWVLDFFVPILWVILIAFFGERVLESDWLFSTVVGIVALLVGCYVYANQYYKLL